MKLLVMISISKSAEVKGDRVCLDLREEVKRSADRLQLPELCAMIVSAV